MERESVKVNDRLRLNQLNFPFWKIGLLILYFTFPSIDISSPSYVYIHSGIASLSWPDEAYNLYDIPIAI